MSKTIGALWARKSKDGKEYFGGVLHDWRGDVQIVVFPNTRKEKETQPDYDIVLSDDGEK